MSSRILTAILLLLVIHEAQGFMKMPGLKPGQSDITHQILMNEASRALNTSYLGQFSGELPISYQGVIFGPGRRPLVSLPVRISHPACPTYINVIFSLDNMLSFSSLTAEAREKLLENCPEIERNQMNSISALVSGHQVQLQESKGDYRTFNIFGSVFMHKALRTGEFHYSKTGNGWLELIFNGPEFKKGQNEEL